MTAGITTISINKIKSVIQRPFFVSFVFFVAKSLPSRAMDETRIPLRRASPFAKASSFAKATEDKTEDKLIRANGFMDCSFLVECGNVQISNSQQPISNLPRHH